jgi:hypothetical protein
MSPVGQVSSVMMLTGAFTYGDAASTLTYVDAFAEREDHLSGEASREGNGESLWQARRFWPRSR